MNYQRKTANSYQPAVSCNKQTAEQLIDKKESIMIGIPFIISEAAFTAVWLAVRAAVWIKQKHIDPKRELILSFMYISLAAIIRFTFFPMALADGKVQPLVFDSSTAFPFRINLFPFVNLFDYDNKRDLLLNVIGNIAMFIPVGILLPIAYNRLNTFWKVLAAGAGVSLCIEILQLPFGARASDIDDLILNTIGVIIGYAVYSLIISLKKKTVI